MISGLLALADETPDDTEVEEFVDGNNATEANATEYLDDTKTYHGKASGFIDTEKRDIVVSGGDDKSVKVTRGDPTHTREHVYTEWVADFNQAPSFVAVDRSEGEFLWNRLGARKGIALESAYIKLEDWLDDYEGQVWADAWSGDEGDDEAPASVRYHDAASAVDSPAENARLLGFQYNWDGRWVRGVLSESGYVALYSTDHYGFFTRWLRDEVLEYAVTPSQEVFDE
jgi:hypothetical protein